MGLGFTNIPDKDGPAVYLLGNSMLERQLVDFGNQLDAATDKQTQVVYLDANSDDGAKVSEFYEITSEQLPAILIIQDDDTIYQSWFGASLPSVQEVAYIIGQITGNSQA